MEHGQLSYDGEALTFIMAHRTRVLSDEEIGALLSVHPDTQITACVGFDYYLVRESITHFRERR